MKPLPVVQWPRPRTVLILVTLFLILAVVAGAASRSGAVIERIAAWTGAMETYARASGSESTTEAGVNAPSSYAAATRWEQTTVTYAFANCPRALDCAAAHQAARQSVEAWDSASGLTLNEAPSGDITILWASGSHGDGNPFDGPGDVLAHAYFPVPWLGSLGGDVHLDDDEPWVIGNPNFFQVDLGTTVMHEVGHALGLDHSRDPSALMWDEYTGVRGLAADDIAGIQSLYGPPNADDGAPPPAPAAAPAPTGVTATAQSTLRIRSGPGTSFPQVGQVPSRTTVPVMGKNAGGNWLFIEHNGVRGWVAGWYTTVNGDLGIVPVVPDNGGGAAPAPPSPNAPAAPTGVTATTIDYTRMRSGPDTSFAQVGSIPINTTVNVLGRNGAGTWLLVDYNGQQGWVATWLVRVNGDVNSVPVVG